MYSLCESELPYYDIVLDEERTENVLPPKSAVPLIVPLTHKQLGMLEPIPYRILKNIRAISCHTHRNAAIDNNDDLWTWGAVSIAMMPDKIHFTVDAPQDVQYVPKRIMGNVQSVATGAWHYMCVTKDHKLWGWGKNDSGQLGIGDTLDRDEPTFVMDGVKSAYAGEDCSYIVKVDDTLWRTGEGHMSQNSTPILSPSYVMADIDKVSVGRCATLVKNKNGDLLGFGDDSAMLLHGKWFTDETPIHISTAIIDMDMPNCYIHYCYVITSNHDLYVLGRYYDHAVPIPWALYKKIETKPLKLMRHVAQASSGRYFSMVRLIDGRLYTYGLNSAGSCGTGKSTGVIRKPRHIMSNVIDMAAGHYHGMALQSNGDLWIWGGDYGISRDELITKQK